MITNLFQKLVRKQVKKHTLVIARTYPDWHSKAGQFTRFGSKILKKSDIEKIHEICTDYDYWIQAALDINKEKAKMSVCYRRIDGRYVEDTKICSLATVNIQKAHFMSTIEEGLKIGNKIIPVSVVAKNHGLSEADFVEWYKNQTDRCIGIIHFTDFKY